MAKYVKKPVEIEAIQWNGSNLDECVEFLGDSYAGYAAERRMDGRKEITVKTLEGQHIASNGDYLIKGIAGEFYPCKPEIFKSTYSEVVE